MRDRPHANIGVRLGEPSRVGDLYLHVIDVDIRDPKLADQARAKLAEIVPGYAALPTVISGSGGDSRHFYLLCEQAFRSKKLAHSAESFIDAEGKKHWAWEIELFGTGKQVAMPPSIHPSGNPYVWEREFDFDLVEMGLGPIVEASVFQPFFGEFAQGVRSNQTPDDDDDDLVGYLREQPLDIPLDRIKRDLADLPFAAYGEDRASWLQVGAAIHHQFGGSTEGLALWNEWSRQSERFDEKDSERVWLSFKGALRPLTFAFVMRRAADARADRMADEDDFDGRFDEDDDEDLLGDIPTKAANDDDEEDLLGEISDVKPAPGKKPTPEIGWRSRLDVALDTGAIRSHLFNAKLIFRNDPRTCGLAAMNGFTGEVVLIGKPGKLKMARESPKGTVQLGGPIWKLSDAANGDIWSNSMDNAVREMIETPKRQGGYGIKISDRDLRAAINISAHDFEIHPVRDYLKSLKWDGTTRVDRLFIDYLGAPENAYTRQVAKMTLVAAVARIMKPGHKFDFATILEGLQGRRKSTFIKILGKNWFSELDGDFHKPKDMVELMQGSWIMEMPELTGFNKSDVPAIKAFISRTSDKVRLAYEARAQVFPRQCIFIGSTNDRRYLRDDTGGRRFWPIECTVEQIDTAGFAKAVDQFWAEAVAIHDQMRAEHGWDRDLPLYLTDEAAQTEAAKLQEDRRIETAEDGHRGIVEEWLEADRPREGEGNGFEEDQLVDSGPAPKRQVTCLLQIWVEALGNTRASYKNPESTHVGRIMRQIPGWESCGFRESIPSYGQVRVYKRLKGL